MSDDGPVVDPESGIGLDQKPFRRLPLRNDKTVQRYRCDIGSIAEGLYRAFRGLLAPSLPNPAPMRPRPPIMYAPKKRPPTSGTAPSLSLRAIEGAATTSIIDAGSSLARGLA
jgi:hypothetical protein